MRKIVSMRLFTGLFAAAALSAGLAAPVFAASPGAVGSWSVVDHGQGCWGGGSLFLGGGECAFQTPVGEEVAKIQPVSWSFTDSTDTAVLLTANFVGQKGPVFPVGVPVPMSVTVPVGNVGAPVPDGQGDYVKVNIFSSKI